MPSPTSSSKMPTACARDAFFAALAARFGVQRSIESLIADYRGELRAALAPVRTDVIQRLCALRCRRRVKTRPPAPVEN